MSGPGATQGPVATMTGGGGGATEEGTASLVVDGLDDLDGQGSWNLDGGANISPTTTLVAAVWTETTTDPSGELGDLITDADGHTVSATGAFAT